MPQAPPAHTVVQDLVAWYAQAKRDLPWRRDPTPYKVLLSELMLQQTRVDTVIPYFERFTTTWPTLADLAAADEEAVLQAWSGLGYYQRARNLLRCARAATEAGGLPDAVDGLRDLPGIGPYTAGAVASIAFGIRTPLVDGNVERVLSRLDGRETDPKSTPGKKALWKRTADLHEAAPDSVHPGDLNQALMELGATVCTPRNPRCDACPLVAGCVAKATDRVHTLPTPRARKAPKPVKGVCGLLYTPDGLVMGCRPEGLLGGLWEPISVDLVGDASAEASLVQAFAERTGLSVQIAGFRGEVVHVFTHRRLTCAVYDVVGKGVPTAAGFYTEVRAVSDPESVPLSTLARKILALKPQLGLPLAAERP